MIPDLAYVIFGTLAGLAVLAAVIRVHIGARGPR